MSDQLTPLEKMKLRLAARAPNYSEIAGHFIGRVRRDCEDKRIEDAAKRLDPRRKEDTDGE